MSQHLQIIEQFIAESPSLTAAQWQDLLPRIQDFFNSVNNLGHLANTLADWCMENDIDLSSLQEIKGAGNLPAPPVTPEKYKELIDGIQQNVINTTQAAPPSPANTDGKSK